MDGEKPDILIDRRANMDLFCVKKDYTILEAIDRIEAAKNRAVIVLNERDSVIGVLSQGDIIRALISGKDLRARIESLIRPNFFYIKDYDMRRAYEIFKKFELTILPVVDDDFHLKSVITISDIYRYIDNE